MGAGAGRSSSAAGSVRGETRPRVSRLQFLEAGNMTVLGSVLVVVALLMSGTNIWA
jgi:hypothetical protein